MKVDNERRRGVSYLKRAADINCIYDKYVKTGLSNREIWRRYIYPVYGISERTLYNILKSRSDSSEIEKKSHVAIQGFLFPELLSPSD
ncbi:MAG: hypothetical protein IJ163_03220 [Bacteroidaceae bacterium]|nr:hypothetical protein [Bacteroidaceae bacterium]